MSRVTARFVTPVPGGRKTRAFSYVRRWPKITFLGDAIRANAALVRLDQDIGGERMEAALAERRCRG
jgi:hypothetical protein